jgi:CRP-like cAMP-binding protein
VPLQLLNLSRLRSATIKCDTPVHAMEISREYFEKYLAKSDSGLLLTLREKDKIRKRNRAKMILRSQDSLVKRNLAAGDVLFEKGASGDSLFLVESGRVHIVENGKNVFTATPGNVFGEYAVLTGRPRNCSAYCADGCVLLEMAGKDFHKLADTSPDIKESLQELSLRRDFKKAVVLRLQKEFPYDNPREAFDAVKIGSSDELNFASVSSLMRELNPGYTDDEIMDMIRALDLNNSGSVTFEEFEKVFVADIRKSASI